MRQRMIATRPFRYGTRMLQAGDEFEATPQDARVLSAVRRAAPAPQVKQPEGDDDLDALRAEAAELGVEVDGRWKARRLRSEIAKARGD